MEIFFAYNIHWNNYCNICDQNKSYWTSMEAAFTLTTEAFPLNFHQSLVSLALRDQNVSN